MIKELTGKLTGNISKAVRGKDEQIKLVCAALFAGGHVLLEDVPGTGKTLLSRSLARSVDGDFRRVQFTPDLLPSDITGINFYNNKHQEFVLRKGPVFTNILLADEINRATPRTQSALLECMEEQQTTIDGDTLKLPFPFFVIATQNPIETQGTYPLPEAQLDRFMIRLSLGYPNREEELKVIRGASVRSAGEDLTAVCTKDEIISVRNEVDLCRISDVVCGYIADIAAATRNNGEIKLGLSTRGAAALKRFCCALACMDGRDYVIPEDVKAAAPYVITHRLICKGYSQNIGKTNILDSILQTVPVPTE